MNKRNSVLRISSTAMLMFASVAATASAQDESETGKAIVQPTKKSCFLGSEEVVDNEPKRKASSREKKILDKTVGAINKMGSQKEAFSKLDKDHDCQLNRSEVSKLLSYAKINGFVRAIATGRLITRYDLSHDGNVQWPEFHHAVEKALEEKSEK